MQRWGLRLPHDVSLGVVGMEGVYVDEVFFLGGVEKSKVLKAFKPHIFFDDQELHLETAAHYVPSGKVPYKSGSPLKNMES